MRVRPFLPKDSILLGEFRSEYPEGVQETPHGFEREPFVETAVATREDGSLVASLTATIIAALDPFISDPKATDAEKAIALRQLSVALEYAAQKAGAAEVFTAVPDHLTDYHRVLERHGWERTAPGCVIFRKSLLGGESSNSAVD
jgi:hypothetical protein